MRSEIERMYTSGELDRMLRWCGVKEADLPDLRQEVAEILLTTTTRISNLHQYTFSVINRQYKSRNSRWWRRYGRWNTLRNDLQDAGREIYQDSGLGYMGDRHTAAEDVQSTAEAVAERTDNLPDGAGTWYNFQSGSQARSASQHRKPHLPQDRKKDSQ